jgi:2-polyprenyl-6-methoxyphenol hydroxylase-like FAD-dependent oxidoreductase
VQRVARIVVCGGGVVGLSAATMLARDGHDVTVLEWDPAPPPTDPADAFDSWERQGVAQFHQTHNLLPGARAVFDAELPGVTEALVAAGCAWFKTLGSLPPDIPDREPRPEDGRFEGPTGRRPVVEAVLAATAESTPGVDVRRGVEVTGLMTGPDVLPGTPHITGVRTSHGDLAADLVVDAMGRRSPTVGWIEELGRRGPLIESQDCGFIYYTQYFHGPQMPVMVGPPVAPLGSISVLTIPGDNDTWSVTVWFATGDAALKELRHDDVFRRVIGACPLQAHWLDGRSLGSVEAMGGIVDRYRRFVVDGAPVMTGLLTVGDAWCCTNPSAGRGISVGLLHAQALRRVVRDQLGDPAALAHAWDAATEETVTPYYRAQRTFDEHRFAEMEALRNGDEPPDLDPADKAFRVAAFRDGDVFRGYVESLVCLATPETVLTRPGMRDRIAELGDGDPFQLPGPDREQLLKLVAG